MEVLRREHGCNFRVFLRNLVCCDWEVFQTQVPLVSVN
jgi:hypothetical protein